MADSKKNTSTEEIPGKSQNKKGIGWMIAIIIVLVAAISVLVYLNIEQGKEMVEMEEVLTSEKDSLARELGEMMFSYDTLKTSSDSIKTKISEEQDKIKRLLSLQASNAQLIRTYKKELSTLRNVMKSYIVQIDSLNTRNKMLTAENIDVRSRLQRAENEKEELTEIKEDLSKKVEVASVIKAANIIAEPINERGKFKDKINKMTKVRVCFTLRENAIAVAGNKFVYIRIIRPDEVVVVTSAENLFETLDGPLAYSARREVEYLNQDVDLCIYYDNDGQFIPGTYQINLFTDGNVIGSTTFLLK
jgi:hypothetical protein